MAAKTTVVIKTRTTRTFADRLARLAKVNRRSVAEEVRIALERHLEAPGRMADNGDGTDVQ
jgi:hypothetical protein